MSSDLYTQPENNCSKLRVAHFKDKVIKKKNVAQVRVQTAMAAMLSGEKMRGGRTRSKYGQKNSR